MAFIHVVVQENLIRSHAAGVGEPLTLEQTRMLLALRINVLAKGYSGISKGNLTKLVLAFNAIRLSFVPQKGTVGKQILIGLECKINRDFFRIRIIFFKLYTIGLQTRFVASYLRFCLQYN
jgi:hypothetical protein